MTTTPSRVDPGSLEKALAELVGVLGKDRVMLESEDTEREYRDPFQPASWDYYLPSAIVFPHSTEEVQEIVRIANRHTIPIWTHSTGKNNGYGGAAPGYGGAITISMRQMNKVLEINEELAYVVVEPGVTWRSLYETLTAGGHRLMVTNPDLGWGSVIGNTLEHGVSYGPTGSDYGACCGMEVVTPDGDVLRTGMGSMTDNPTFHTYKRSFGPSIDTLFMQSNLGIVTKMGFWLIPAPEYFNCVWTRCWKDDDLIALVDNTRRLRLERTIEGVPGMFNTVLLASAFARRSDFYTGEGSIPDPVIDQMGKQLEIGRWMFRTGLYGHEAQTDMQYERIKAAMEQIPGADVWRTKVPFDEIANLENPGELVVGGVPNLEALHMIGWYNENDGGHLDFSPVIPLVGKEVYKVHSLLRNTLETEAGLDYQVGSCAVNPRSTIHVGLITFDASDEEVSRRCYGTLKKMIGTCAEAGYGEYRSHVDHMDEIASHYDFNDHAYRRYIEKIKDAVDPNGILSPGKQGIWPERLRDQRGESFI
ncbi:unannotated protein [freshwater metagenome]|uniref:Unannotated protein n=1 Tax=freshwater metagenome TaxID=449393 RepID=A0A6J7IFA6_9ZZZZ|nr:FAD-binding protein [Actinomycetota bacterium]